MNRLFDSYPCPDCGEEARHDSTLGLVCANKQCESYYLKYVNEAINATKTIR